LSVGVLQKIGLINRSMAVLLNIVPKPPWGKEKLTVYTGQ
jgi:hypothetical protein